MVIYCSIHALNIMLRNCLAKTLQKMKKEKKRRNLISGWKLYVRQHKVPLHTVRPHPEMKEVDTYNNNSQCDDRCLLPISCLSLSLLACWSDWRS